MYVPNPYERTVTPVTAGGTGVFPFDPSALESAREVVVVDSRIDRYADFVAAANAGQIGLHFCSDAQSAIKLSRRFRADVWLVSSELPDMELFELLPLLAEQIEQRAVGERRWREARRGFVGLGQPRSLASSGGGLHPGLFVVAEEYRIDDEQRALAAGVAGYLTQPVTVGIVQSLRCGVPSVEDVVATA